MTKTVPAPVVTWETVVAATDPISKPSRAKVRTLRQKGLLSGGVHVQQRSGGRASGSRVYHSALYAIAAQAKQAGDDSGAETLSRAGEALEDRFAERLRTFLSQHLLKDLDQAYFYRDLVTETDQAIQSWHGADLVVFAAGKVEGRDGDSLIIEAKRHGESISVDIPRSLLDSGDLPRVDYVWLFRRIVGSAAVLSVLPAVSAYDGDADSEEEEGANYLRSEAGSPPSAAEAAILRSLPLSRLPRRRPLRPVG